MFKFGEVVCVPVVAPDKIWRFDAKNDIAIYIGQPEGVVGGGRVLFPWDGRVLVRGSLSKVTAHIDDINRWIGVRNEMMQGKLAQGQLLQKLLDELDSAKDKLERFYMGEKSQTSKLNKPLGGDLRFNKLYKETQEHYVRIRSEPANKFFLIEYGLEIVMVFLIKR